jgi:MFS family permease
MALGCTIATMLLVDSDRDGNALSKRQSVVYSVALGAAIGTQFYAVLVLAAHVATLAARRRFDRAWRQRVEVVVAIGVIPYVAMLRTLLESTRNRRGTFRPGFPLDATRALLGQQWVAVALLAALTIYAVSFPGLRRALRPAAAVVAVALVAIWVGLHPLDLYPRFLVWLVPAVALAAACAVARRRALTPLALVAVAAMAISQVGTWTADPSASRQLAREVESARAHGQTPCAVASSGEVILGYTQRIRSVFQPSQLAGCDALYADTAIAALARGLICHFEHHAALPGPTPVVVYTEPVGVPADTRCPP